MLTRLIEGTRARLRDRRTRAGSSDGLGQIDRDLLDLLALCEEEEVVLALRDLHLRLEQPQPGILRAVKTLKACGLVEVHSVPHDPLASRVTLPPRPKARR